MYINSGYLNNSRTDFKDNSTPLVVGSCGTYRLKTRPNLPTYWQKGRRDYQILYVANGKTHFWFDGKEEIVSAGHMVLYKPEEIQKYVYYLEDNPEVFWIHFTGSDVKNILAYHGISLDEHVFYCGVLPDYKALFRKIIQELQLCRYGYEDYIASLFNDILLLVDRQQHEQKKATGDVQEQIERAAAYFNENYNTKISIGQFWLLSTEIRLSFVAACFVPTLQQTIDRTGVYRKALCQFFYANAFVVSFQNQLSSFVVQHSTHLLCLCYITFSQELKYSLLYY